MPKGPNFAVGGLVLAILAGAVADGAEQDLRPVGRTAEGRLMIDKASQHDHHGHGYERVLATVELADPVAEAGRTLARADVTLDWDCARGRLRTVERIYRTAQGEYVRREPSGDDWRAVPLSGAERAAFELVCPRARQGEPPEAGGPEAASQRRRSEAQVVWMPGPRR